MRKAATDAWISAALAYVPKGDICQSVFRTALIKTLKHELGSKKPQHPSRSVADAVRAAQAASGCQPSFNQELLSLEWPPRG